MILGKLKQFVPTMFKKSGKIGQRMEDISLYGYRGDIDGISVSGNYDADIEKEGVYRITDTFNKIQKKADREYPR